MYFAYIYNENKKKIQSTNIQINRDVIVKMFKVKYIKTQTL